MAVEGGEVIALAGVGFLAGDVGETVIFHVLELTNLKYKLALTAFLFQGTLLLSGRGRSSEVVLGS